MAHLSLPVLCTAVVASTIVVRYMVKTLAQTPKQLCALLQKDVLTDGQKKSVHRLQWAYFQKCASVIAQVAHSEADSVSH